MMPEYRQLSFELPGLVEPLRRGKKSRLRRKAKAAYSETFLELFEVTAPPDSVARQQILQERGLRLDCELTTECQGLVNTIGLGALAAELKVYWNPRLVTTAGLAHHGSARIDLNSRLNRFFPEEPGRTLRHELAHLVAHYSAAGRSIQPHGLEWRKACTALGIPGEQRCHNLPLTRRAVKRKFAYQCRHCGIIVPRVRKLSRDSACYPCCREYNRGRYSSRFLLDSMPLGKAKKLAPEYAWG